MCFEKIFKSSSLGDSLGNFRKWSFCDPPFVMLLIKSYAYSCNVLIENCQAQLKLEMSIDIETELALFQNQNDQD